MNSIRVLLSIVASKGWPLWQLDVKNAFLHGDLMRKCIWYLPKASKFQEVRLRYASWRKHYISSNNHQEPGLKDLVAVWRSSNTSNHRLIILCLLSIHKKGPLQLLFYVNDIVITRDDSEEVWKWKVNLGGEFKVKDLGTLHYFLGIVVAVHYKFVDRDEVIRGQTCRDLYWGKLWDKWSWWKTPNWYWKIPRLVGKFIYLSFTRLDIAFAVGVVSQFIHALRAPHLEWRLPSIF